LLTTLLPIAQDNLLAIIDSDSFNPNAPPGGYDPNTVIACSGPLCAYYIQHVGPPKLDPTLVQPLAKLIADHCGDASNRGPFSQGRIVGASPIQLAPGGDGQNDVDGGEMRIDAGFGGSRVDGLNFPLNTVDFSSFTFTGCNDVIANPRLTQDGGCQPIGNPFESIQAQLHGNSCTLSIFSDMSCTARVATVDLVNENECISQDGGTNMFTNGAYATLCCEAECGHY
jgi:hypothetical protein